jgi:hypothetical protein
MVSDYGQLRSPQALEHEKKSTTGPQQREFMISRDGFSRLRRASVSSPVCDQHYSQI